MTPLWASVLPLKYKEVVVKTFGFMSSLRSIPALRFSDLKCLDGVLFLSRAHYIPSSLLVSRDTQLQQDNILALQGSWDGGGVSHTK